MHLQKVIIHPESFPQENCYPFNLPIFRATGSISFHFPVTFFIGENGAGKSTMLRAIARKCSIHIWKEAGRRTYYENKFSEDLYRHIDTKWADRPVPGSFFASEIFSNFALVLDEWARTDPAMLEYYGGESLLSKSHGQCHMAFFQNRYRIKGLYLLDEPENALSPKKQLELLRILQEMGRAGHAQFIIATHSPILLALPGAEILSFDHIPVKPVQYEETDYYNTYRDFLNNRHKYLP